MKTKKLLALLFAVSIILAAGPFDIFLEIFAGLSPYDTSYGKGTYSDPADYREIHSKEFKGNGASVPITKFSVINKADKKVIGTSATPHPVEDKFGEKLTIVENIPVGTVINITNLSTVGSGTAIDMLDFQVTKDNSQVSSIQVKPSDFNYELALNTPGTYKFYLCVRDNTAKSITDGWGNWSYNGSHVAKGLNYGVNDIKETTGTPETAGGDDFWGLWYFAQVVVKVTKNPPNPDFTISYKGINVTDNKSNPATMDPSNKSLVLQDMSQPFSAAELITGRKWYYWNVNTKWTEIPSSENKTTVNIADMDTTLDGSGENKSFKLVCTSNTGAEAFKEHIAYFVPAPPPPPSPGLADIFVYYKDKATDIDVSPPDLTTYKGKSYGTYSIPAAVVSGYTLDTSTPSPKSVTVDAANNSVKVIFLYNSQGGGTPGNKPPVAVITGANTIFAGEEVTLSGTGSYDPDGEIVAYGWEIDTGTLVYNNGNRVRLWYEEPGNKTPELTVTDDDGATDWTEHDIRVKEPVPTVNLVVTGKLKENRKVTLDASDTYSPKHYPINYYNWTINNSTDLKLLVPLNSAMKHDVLFKSARSYIPVITVKNTYGLSGSDTETIAIAPDQNPKVNFSAVVKLLRNPADSAKNATITATNLSSSPDSDPIKATVMFYAYDSNNNGSFDDETWYYSLNGTTWLAVGLTYAQLKAGSFDIYTKGIGNPATFTVKTNQVGKYKFEAMTIENIPAADTIPSLITAADYRRNSTFTSKPDSEKIIEVMNTAPTITFEAKKKKEVDILIATDYTGQNLANLQASLNVQKATLLAKNIDVKYTLVNTTSPVAHVNDAKFWYRRYARYNYRADRESWSSGGGGNDSYDKNYQETLLWEEQQALESEVGYLPPRMPRNITWSKSGIIFEEDEEGVKNWEREYYNVTVMAQNDIKTSGIIKKTVYSRGGMSSDTSYGYEFSNIHMESVSLDSSFVKEEKIADLVLTVNSINFASLTSAALRENSDRYLLFIGDSSSKVYSGEWGTHFPFGGLTKSEQDYIKSNNINPYIVTPQTTLDTIIGAEKAEEVYGGTMPYFKTTDGAYYTILENYPAMLNLEGEIQEIFGEYILLTNGTLKYRVGGASFATVVTGVTKVIKEKSTYGYETGDSGSIWVVTSNGKLRQCLSGSIGITLDYPNAQDVFNNSGLRDGEGTYTISCTDGSYFRYKNGTVLKVSDYSLHSVSGVNIYDQEFDYTTEYGGLFVSSNGAVRLGVLWHGSTWNSERSTYEYYIEKVNLKSLYRGRWSDEDRMYYANTSSPFPTVKIIADENFIVDGTVNKSLSVGLDYSGTYQRYFALTSEPSKILINYKDGIETYADGTLGIPFKSYYAYTTSNDRDRSGYITTMWDVPELRGKTIVKAYVMECVTIILTSDNSLYAWVDRRNYGQGGRPTTCGLTLLTNNAGAIMKGAAGASYNSQAGIYHDKNDGTVRSMVDKSILFSNVTDAKSTADNTIFYTVTKDGTLYKDNQTANLIKTRLVINDTTKQYITLRSILSSIPSTKYFTAGQYAAAVQDITNIYLNDTSYTTNYILVNDEMSLTTAYSDYENDLKFAEEWKFLHEPYYFDNTMGLAPFHGQTLTSPVTKYAKKGRYTINLRGRDNPKNDVRFKNDTNEANNFYKWSTGNQNVLLYVHEKPIALARVTITNNGNDTYTVKALDAGSYDPDHNNSRSDKGIAAREWRWKEATSTTWTSGQMNKTDCTADKSYIIQLRVKDIEGVWSDYYTITIDENNPPVALFSLDKTLIKNTEPLKVKDQSYPQSFSTITNWHWIVRKVNADGSASSSDLYKKQATSSNNGTGAMAGYDVNVMTNYSSSGVGTFRVYLRVKDSNGLWSDGGTDSTPGDLSKFYSMDFDVDKAPTPSFTVAKSVIKLSEILKVRDTTTTAGISGIAKWHWIVEKLNADGSAPSTSVKNKIFTNSNTGTEALTGYDSNVTTDYQPYGTGTYRIYLRACNGNGMWSDGGTDTTFTLGSFFYRDIVVDAPPIPGFTIAQNPIEPADILKLRDTSTAAGVSNIDRWHWIVKKLNPDGSVIDEPLQDEQHITHNAGTGVLAEYDSNVKTDYEDNGPGTYRIYLRVRNANGMWSDEGTDATKNLEKFFYRDLLVQESFKVSNFRVVKVRDLHLESYYYNPSTGQFDDRPMGVSSMAIDQDNFGGMVDGLTKGYLFEFEIDTVNFNGNNDSIIITPRFFTCQGSSRNPEERDLYWENSYHEILKVGEGAHEAWAYIKLEKENRKITGENKATWRGSYLIPGTSWAVPRGTAASNAVSKKLKRDIIVNFGIKAYKAGVMKYDYNQSQWNAERTNAKQPYTIGDVIRYSYEKCNLDDNNVILNRP